MKTQNWIHLTEKLNDFDGCELWTATCHHDGHTTKGFALASTDVCDFYDSDPRELPPEELVSGLRLPAYMPGFAPEEV